MRDSKSLTESRYHQIEDCDDIDEQTVAAVRLVLCGNAADAQEAEEWMKMLGIFPGQEDIVSMEERTRVPSWKV